MSSDPPKRLGRPPKAPGERATTPVRSVRLDDARWAKLQRLGRAWLERAIDRAKVAEATTPSPDA